MENKAQLRKKLFLSTFYLSAFTFGGGYVIITLLKNKFVDQYHWIDEKEMLDLVAIAQSAPGVMAVNGAIVVGYKLDGLIGVLISILGTVLPPFIIITIVSYFYEAFQSNQFIALMLDGMQSGVAAVIAAVVLDMALGIVKEKSILNNIVMVIAFICAFVFKINVAWIVITCIIIGVARMFIFERRHDS
ncbi:chromate transporter [Anaerorhabdus furcosa]|uniref:Chromate transporter n=1 Tax=Anaerorhabdus furcosa TaxID=118967 RepID=A0A1T4MEF4_9FIRM|nr:chromate transporter [Anaerorhabdus furcosa]SJZ65322.1 chromate transporter [Anaerorhabdus furcosa]